MNPVQAVILGVVQGLTEFFPVSSSGHLVIFQQLFGLREPALLFDVCVHVGTLLAVVAYFYKDIERMALAFFRFLKTLAAGGAKRAAGGAKRAAAGGDPDLKMVALILVGTVPTGLLGFGFHQVADQLFASLLVVGLALLLTTGLLVATRLVKAKGRDILAFTVLGAVVVGVAQALAAIPGVSRSGATIATCLILGLNRDTAARFSFLLSIPAILGALILSLVSGSDTWGEFTAATLILGTLVSAGVGYAALATLIKIVRHGRLYYFAPYCLLLGLLTLGLGGWN